MAIDLRDTAEENTMWYFERESAVWRLAALLLLCLSVGCSALLLTRVAWHSESLDPRTAHSLGIGLVVLIVLFNLYVLEQRRAFGEVVRTLTSRVAESEQMVATSFIDPLTDVFNRRSLDYLWSRETARAERCGEALSIMIVDVNRIRRMKGEVSRSASDALLQEAARLLTMSSRRSDIIVRYDRDDFLILMPATTESQAWLEAQEVFEHAAAWNAEPGTEGGTLELSCGVAQFDPQSTLAAAVDCANRCSRGDGPRQLPSSGVGVR